MTETNPIHNITKQFGYDNEDLPTSTYPIRYSDISTAQAADNHLQRKISTHADYSKLTFRGGNKDHLLICNKSKILLPKTLQKKTVE